MRNACNPAAPWQCIVSADTAEDFQRETAKWLDDLASTYRRQAMLAERKKVKKAAEVTADAYAHAARVISGAIIERKAANDGT